MHLSREKLLLFEAHSCFRKQMYVFRQENSVLEKWLMQGRQGSGVWNSASGRAGGRPQNPRLLHYHHTTLPSHKTNPVSWSWTLENGKKCDRLKSQIPWAFWLLANPHKAHISLSSHLSASEFVLLSCEWWKLKSYVDMYSMWKTTPRFLLPWKGRRYTYTFLGTQTDLFVHLCTHSTSLDTRLKKHSVLWADLMGSHGLSSQTLAKKRWDPTHP